MGAGDGSVMLSGFIARFEVRRRKLARARRSRGRGAHARHQPSNVILSPDGKFRWPTSGRTHCTESFRFGSAVLGQDEVHPSRHHISVSDLHRNGSKVFQTVSGSGVHEES